MGCLPIRNKKNEKNESVKIIKPIDSMNNNFNVVVSIHNKQSDTINNVESKSYVTPSKVVLNPTTPTNNLSNSKFGLNKKIESNEKSNFEPFTSNSKFIEEELKLNNNKSQRLSVLESKDNPKPQNNEIGPITIKTINKEGIIIEKPIDFNFDRDFLVKEHSSDPYEYYSIDKVLGEGSFGKVYKVQHKISGEYRAMKMINKTSTNLTLEEEEEILKEIKVLKMLDHPNILKIYEYFNTHRKLFIVSELCTGGELFDRIIEVKYFTETVASHIMKQIFSAIAFCHSNNIIHRDLKPENILIESQEERKKEFFNIKIIDFGTSEILKHKMLSEQTGTAYYIAPEVINNNYNEKCDLWSCGVIFYILLCGCPPFNGESDDEIFSQIKKGEYQLKGEVWKDISSSAINLISQLLTKDLSKRLSAQQALNHQWFKDMFTDKNRKILENQKITFQNNHLKEIVSNIKNFRAEKKLQQASLAFIVHTLASSEDVKSLRNVFIAFDLNGDGRLTKDELIEAMSQLMTRGEARDEVEKIMKVIDVDKNGFIEYEEFLRATLNKDKLLSKENIKYAFDMFDKDGSGFISKEEIKAVLGKGKNNKKKDNVWKDIINQIDLNQDGQISFEEFTEAMIKMIEKNQK